MMNVGLLGAGRIGQVHAVNIAEHRDSRLVAVSDVHAPSAGALASKYGAEVRESADIISDPNVDAVLIATSTDTHSDLIEAAASAGKAILCEKPVDLSLQRAKACLAKTEKSGVPIMIGFNRRFDAQFAALHDACERGEIGKPELLSITSFDPAPPPVSYIKVSGGLFRDMMIHDFDMAHFVMGALPETIHATGSSLVDPEIGSAGDVDTAAVSMTYADGRIAVIKNSRRAVYGYDQRLELLGSEGLLQVQNMPENKVVKATTDGVVSAKPVFFFLERYMPAYAAEWDAFVSAVQTQGAVPVTLADGVAALACAEAATQSLQTDAPVALASLTG